MCRNRLLLLLALVVAAVILVVFWPTPTPTPTEQPPPPPVVKRRERPLQADAEGHYVPGYRFVVNRFRFTDISLHPQALVTFAQTASGSEQSIACLEALIRADTVHLRCDDPAIGTVTVDGRFLTRFATNRLDAAVLSAVVAVRSGSGETLYRARDSFQWHPAN